MNLLEGLDIQYARLEDDVFESCMKLGSFHAQPFGYLNGGATLAFAEIVGGMMSTAYLDQHRPNEKLMAVGQTVTAQHVNPKRSTGYLYAYGELIKHGKRTHVWSIRMVDEKDQLISYITAVNAIIPCKR